MIAQFFIDRPVFANVLAILLVLLGAVALAHLPVAEYPDVAPPKACGEDRRGSLRRSRLSRLAA